MQADNDIVESTMRKIGVVAEYSGKRRGRAAAVNINKSRAQPGNEAENGRYGAVKGRYRAIICPIRQGLLPGDAGR